MIADTAGFWEWILQFVNGYAELVYCLIRVICGEIQLIERYYVYSLDIHNVEMLMHEFAYLKYGQFRVVPLYRVCLKYCEYLERVHLQSPIELNKIFRKARSNIPV